MATIKQDILDFAEDNPGFQSWQAIQHLKKIRKKVNPANVTTLLKEMTEGKKPELTRSLISNHPCRVYQYRRI